MINVVLRVAYDGTAYFGWQKTKEGSSIEECLEKAISQILQHKVHLQAASRTDRGVHALGQIVNFLTEKEIHDFHLLKRGMNALLPKDIVVLEAKGAPLDFHPTLNARAKVYSYEITAAPFQLPFWRHFAWHMHVPLDVARMRQASSALIGTHDFSSFCNAKENEFYQNHVRTVSRIQIRSDEQNRIFIEITGEHFLYKMVRNIVGTLVYVGCGKIDLADVPNLLLQKDRKCAGMTAPAHGLTLLKVTYDGTLFAL